MLSEIDIVIESQDQSLQLIIGGDFNVDLTISCKISSLFRQFLNKHCLELVYDIVPYKASSTFCSSTGASSKIDFVAIHSSLHGDIEANDILDIEPNFSDHLPVAMSLSLKLNNNNPLPPVITSQRAVNCNGDANNEIKFLRWDHADLISYYFDSYDKLSSISTRLNEIYEQYSLADMTQCCQNSSLSSKKIDLFVLHNVISDVYNSVVTVLSGLAWTHVPLATKDFYKYWWDQELSTLKEESVAAHNAWKSAGKPNSGDLCEAKRVTKSRYRKSIREHKTTQGIEFNNNLHEALLKKTLHPSGNLGVVNSINQSGFLKLLMANQTQ